MSDDAVFTRTFPLESGPRVRLRLARPSDREAVAALLAAQDVDASDIDVARLLAYDPLSRRVLAAFALCSGVDSLVGVGGIDLDADEVDTLVVDPRFAPALSALLDRVLVARAQASARRRAA